MDGGAAVIGLVTQDGLRRCVPGRTLIDKSPCSLLLQFFVVVVSINNFLQTINCSVNYIIYYGHCWKRTGILQILKMLALCFIVCL